MLKNNSILLEKHKDILSFRDLSIQTVANYTSCMTSYIEWVEENLPGRELSSVTWEEVRSYFRYLSKIKEYSNSTVNIHIAQLRDFYYYVLCKDWDKRQVPSLRIDERLPIVPTKEQVNSIIEAITNPKHKAEIALLYSSGIRVSELCRLHCGDIKKTKNCIYISRSKNRSDRYAILSGKAYLLLVDYIRKAYKGAKPGDWLFPGQTEGKHINPQSVRNIINNMAESIGLGDKGYNPRSLRHAFGLHLYEAGVDLMSIKEAMGHKSLSSTTVYLTLGIGNGRSVKSPYDLD